MKSSTIRWSVYKAAAEFDIHRETLTKRISSAGISADADGTYSTADIVRALYGDLEGEKTRLTREQADIAAIRKHELLKESIPGPLVESVWGKTLTTYRDRVLCSDIPRELKEELLAILEPEEIDSYFANPNQSTQDDTESSPEVA